MLRMVEAKWCAVLERPKQDPEVCCTEDVCGRLHGEIEQAPNQTEHMLPSIMLHHHVMDDVRNARWSHYLKERLQREAVQTKLLGLRGAKMMLLRWCSSGRIRFLHEGIDLSVIFFIEYCLPRLEDTCTQIEDRSSVIVTTVDRCCFHATNAWLLAAWIWSEQLLLPGQVQRPGCTRLVTIFCKEPIKTRNLYMYIYIISCVYIYIESYIIYHFLFGDF